MATNDEQVRLILEVMGEEGVAELRKQLAATREQAGLLVAAYGRGEVAQEDFDAESKQLSATLRVQETLLEDLARAESRVAAEAAKAAAAQEKQAAATVKAGSGMKGFNTEITAAGYAFQDFTSTSGDLGQKLNSISNNLPMLLQRFGVWGQVAAGVSVALIAIYRSWDQIVRAFESKNPFPDAAESAEMLEGALRKNNAELDKLRENTSLTASELDRFNKLTAENIKLTEQKEKAEEKAAAARKLRKLEAPGAEEEAKARAEVITGAIGGRQAEVQKQISDFLSAPMRAAEAQIQERLEKLPAGPPKGLAPTFEEQAIERRRKALEGQLAMVRKGIAAAGPEQRKQVEAMLAGAAEGKVEPIRRIGEMMRRAPGAFAPGDVEAFRQAQPEAMAAEEKGEAAFERRNEQAREIREAEEKKARRDKAFNAKVDALNEQGRENQRAFEEAEEKKAEAARKKAEAEAEAEAKKAAHEALPEVKRARREAARREQVAQQEDLAGGMAQRMAPQTIGMPITPDQARAAGEMAVKIKEQAGNMMTGQEAVTRALFEVLASFQQMNAHGQRVAAQANQAAMGFQRMRINGEARLDH